jgi:hypothetical protein
LDGPVDLHLLCQSWLRSRSEDTETEQVYRPAGYAFPRPERGRAGYQFNADGTAKRMSIGATDVSEVATGTWHTDKTPERIRIVVDGRAEVLEIADLTPDRLAVRRATAAGGA